MTTPRWLLKAQSYRGLTEQTNAPRLSALFLKEGLRLNPQTTPWCAAFVGGVLEECGIQSTKSAWARSYLQWGVKLASPLVGCIVVFSRGVRNGHVALFLGFTKAGDIRVLGGNQHDSVSEAVMPRGRVLGFRWPPGEPCLQMVPLPPIPPDAPRSTVLDEPRGYEPEAVPVRPTVVATAVTPTGMATGGLVLGGAGETLRAGNEIAAEITMAKYNATSLGLVDILTAHPGLLIGLVVIVAGAFVFWDHHRYRKALSESQASP